MSNLGETAWSRMYGQPPAVEVPEFEPPEPDAGWLEHVIATSDDVPPPINGSRGRRATATQSVAFPLLSSYDFAAADYRHEWLIKGILVAKQPCIVGAPRKGMKTSIMADLAISLGTATPFLGEFATPHRIHVGFFSGESGPATLQETAFRICRQRGFMLEQCDVHWGFKLPQLSRADHLAALQASVKDHALKVVIIDPLYLCLLAGNVNTKPQDLFGMGPLLLGVAECCLEAGATPILVHHTIKRPVGEHVELEDLAYSGVQEFARQWLLLSRAEKYTPGTGSHKMHMSVGGSAGHGGEWAVDIEEGVQGEDFEGRRWDVSVRRWSEARAEMQERAETAKEEAVEAKYLRRDDSERRRVLAAAAKFPNGETVARICSEARIHRDRRRAVIEDLVESGDLEECSVAIRCGTGTRQTTGYRPHQSTQVHTSPRNGVERCVTPTPVHPSLLETVDGCGVHQSELPLESEP